MSAGEHTGGGTGGRTAEHAALMDRVYRRQRHLYDATRKYFLLGRDRLIADLDPPAGGRVLEIGCGTGRNLVLAARRYPRARFYGLDISAEMLESARAKIARAGLAERVTLIQGDATAFSAREDFGVEGFDRAFFSYTLSMVPDWRAALDCALDSLHPEGRLLVVDFGQQTAMPRLVRAGLHRWLSLFHVAPRAGLAEGLRDAAQAHGGRAVTLTARYADFCWSFQVGPAADCG